MTMIQVHIGNLLNVQRGVIVHGCNALGIMGSGVALAIHQRFPGVYAAYRSRTKAGPWTLGEVQFVMVQAVAGRPSLVVANAITQWNVARRAGEVVVDYEAISKAFRTVGEYARTHRLPVHFPLIGCGLAGGQWREVQPRIEQALPAEVPAHLWVLPECDVPPGMVVTPRNGRQASLL